MPTRAQFYRNTSNLYHTRAQSYLAQNDLLQASEKGWGAAALRIKTVAEHRRWRHREHSNLGQAIERLVAETGDVEFRRLFKSAGDLHRNFYEGRLNRSAVSNRVSRVTALLRKLDQLPP